jgi:hypothetical protein
MVSTTIIWKNPIPPATAEIINSKAAELLNGAENNATFRRYHSPEASIDSDEYDRLSIVRTWPDAESAQTWIDFCETITDHFISGTIN